MERFHDADERLEHDDARPLARDIRDFVRTILAEPCTQPPAQLVR